MTAVGGNENAGRDGARLRRWAGFARSLAIYRARPWRQREQVAFYRRVIAPGDLCFDVGAHLGNHSAAFLSLGARVVAVEPQPDFADFLRRLYAGRDDVTLVTKALSAYRGRAVLHTSSLAPTVSTLSTNWIDRVRPDPGFAQVSWDGRLEVETTTLDALIAEHGLPTYCKIDVEGSEAEVLAGLTRPIPHLRFEVVPAALPVALACLRRLSRLGRYRFNLSLGERPRFAWPDWCDAETARARLLKLGARDRSGDVHAALSP